MKVPDADIDIGAQVRKPIMLIRSRSAPGGNGLDDDVASLGRRRDRKPAVVGIETGAIGTREPTPDTVARGRYK